MSIKALSDIVNEAATSAFAAGGGGGVTINTVTVSSASAYSSAVFDVALAGAALGQKVLASVALDMPAGVADDELQMDPITVSGRVLSSGNIRLIVSSPGIIGSPRNINILLG